MSPEELPVDMLSLDMYSMLTLEDKVNQEGETKTDNKEGATGGSKPKRKAGEDEEQQLGKINKQHVENSGKWPRWRQWNPNKGPYHREPFKEDQLLEPNKPMEVPDLTQGGQASSSGGTPELAKAGGGVYWDSEGRWEEWGGDWWKQNASTGWWEKWQEPECE